MLFSWRSLPPRVAVGRCASTIQASVQRFVPASGSIDSNAVEQLQAFVSQASRLFVISGAGLSTESGIPDYRSEGGDCTHGLTGGLCNTQSLCVVRNQGSDTGHGTTWGGRSSPHTSRIQLILHYGTGRKRENCTGSSLRM